MNEVITLPIPAERLSQIGLTAADEPTVRQLAATLSAGDSNTVLSFGREAHQHTAAFADQLLDEVRNADLDKSGKLLSDVVVAAKSLNLNALSTKRSRLPVIGALIDRFKVSKERVVQQFASTREQIDTLLSEVSHSQAGLGARIQSLDAMHQLVQDEYHDLGLHIAAGELSVAQLAEQQRTLSATSEPASIAELDDLNHRVANIEKRVGDLRVLQQAALQSLPMIRMIQANNAALVDKFHAIRELTVPAWKRQFMLALALNEQKAAAELAGNIDNATNEFLVRNAELLRSNAVATAKSNQRLVIDIETLEKVQKSLISTVEEVIKIHQDGQRDRRQVEGRITTMRHDLVKRLGAPVSDEAGVKRLPH